MQPVTSAAVRQTFRVPSVLPTIVRESFGGDNLRLSLARVIAAALRQRIPDIGGNVGFRITAGAVGSLGHLKLRFRQAVARGSFQQHCTLTLILRNVFASEKGVAQSELRGTDVAVGKNSGDGTHALKLQGSALSLFLRRIADNAKMGRFDFEPGGALAQVLGDESPVTGFSFQTLKGPVLPPDRRCDCARQ